MPLFVVRQYTDYEIRADNEEEAIAEAEEMYFTSSPPDFEFEIIEKVDETEEDEFADLP